MSVTQLSLSCPDCNEDVTVVEGTVGRKFVTCDCTDKDQIPIRFARAIPSEWTTSQA